MKSNIFIASLLILLFIGFSVFFPLRVRTPSLGSHIDDHFSSAKRMSEFDVPVIVVNPTQDGALDSENALLKGNLYLLIQKRDDHTKMVFNDLFSLQQLHENYQGVITPGDYIYKDLEVGQYLKHGKALNEKSLLEAGIRAIEIYPENRQHDKYGQVLGRVVLANGNAYPLQIVHVNSKYLNQ